MKLDKWLNSATKKLQKSGISTARLDCLILLSDALGKDKAWILAHPETSLHDSALGILNKKLAKRARHEPMAYIRGFTEFYGRNFLINKDVLEPRPESETMIEMLKEQVNRLQVTGDSKMIIADIGTGSGAIAITIKLEFPDMKIIGTDIDEKCLVVARKNAKTLKAEVEFIQGNLLEPLYPIPSALSAILANLPYVPDRWAINEAAAMEPKIAIFGGSDGLDLYRQMFKQIDDLAHRNFDKIFAAKPKYIFTESLPPQHVELAKIAKKSGYKLSKTQDFIQLFKKG